MNKQCTYLSNDCTRRGKDIWDSYQVMEVIDKKKKPLLTVPCTCIVCVCCQQLFMCIFCLFVYFVSFFGGSNLRKYYALTFFLLAIYMYKSDPFAGKKSSANEFIYIYKVYYIHSLC